jgi:hypothetical protein
MPRVFAYGTLLWPSRQKRLFGRTLSHSPAVLAGWAKERCVGRYYGIVRRAGARTEGGLLSLTSAELKAADLWERVPALYRRRRVCAQSAGRRIACWVYVPA